MKFKKLVSRLGSKKPLLAVLIDPDKYNPEVIAIANEKKVHCFLVGGSELKNGNIEKTVRDIKKISKIPVLLFPGDERQLTAEADGLLLLSLLSGRNPDYLIEKHISAAPVIKRLNLKYISTAYLLIDGGRASTTQKVTKTKPLDPAKPAYIINTAIAAQQLGFKAIYLEAGSGAKNSIPVSLITEIKKQTSLPVIVGGGISSEAIAQGLLDAGANMLVVGNAFEKKPALLREISRCF